MDLKLPPFRNLVYNYGRKPDRNDPAQDESYRGLGCFLGRHVKAINLGGNGYAYS